MPAVLLEAGSIVNRQEELELATPERRLMVAEAVTAAVEEFCASRGKLPLAGRRRATGPLSQSPRLPEASGRRCPRIISAFMPRKRSWLLSTVSTTLRPRRCTVFYVPLFLPRHDVHGHAPCRDGSRRTPTLQAAPLVRSENPRYRNERVMIPDHFR